MLFPHTVCVVRGGGDLATGVIHRLHHAGFPLIVLELAKPRVVRRMVSVAQAMFTGETQVGDLAARRMTLDEAVHSLDSATVPVVADSEGAAIIQLKPSVIVDARMAKAPLDTTTDAAPFVVGLGPGFSAGLNCHAVIETNRGHDLGRVIWQGAAQPNTDRPEPVMGYGGERVLRAPISGTLRAHREIGDVVQKGDLIARVDGQQIVAPFFGALRGLIYDGLPVTANEKIGDLDPRGRRDHCFTISDKSLAVGGGVVEAVLTWMQRSTTKAR
ncbi:MAG: selenium-dependent molybdenum cofactor biosynthesis protein YqeB [Chloroflexota bacterium]